MHGIRDIALVWHVWESTVRLGERRETDSMYDRMAAMHQEGIVHGFSCSTATAEAGTFEYGEITNVIIHGLSSKDVIISIIAPVEPAVLDLEHAMHDEGNIQLSFSHLTSVRVIP